MATVSMPCLLTGGKSTDHGLATNQLFHVRHLRIRS